MINVCVTSFNIGTGAAGTTVDVAISDPLYGAFTPVAAIFLYSGRTGSTNAAGSATAAFGQGWATSSSNFGCWAIYDQDGVGTSITARLHRTDACIAETGDSVAVGWADVQSFSSGNIRLEILDAFATSLRVTCLALGGDIQAECGTFVMTGTAPVNQTVNNAANFQPDLTIFGGTLDSTAPPAAGNVCRLFLGAAMNSTTEQVSFVGAQDASVSGSTGRYGVSGECIAAGNPATPAMVDRAEFVSHNASPGGFTINYLERTNASYIHWLSIKSTSPNSRFTIQSFTSRTDTADHILSGFGFCPRAIMVVSACATAMTQDQNPVAHAELSVGFGTGPTNQESQYYGSRNGNTNMFVQTALRTDEILINMDPTTDAIEGLYKFKRRDGDGITLSGEDDAQPTADVGWLWAVGEVLPPARIVAVNQAQHRASYY